MDGSGAPEIREWFGGEVVYPDVTPEIYADRLRNACMRIDDRADRWEGRMNFTTAAALVTYLGLAPWDAPGFTVDAHASRLLELDAAAPIEMTQRRFRVYATTP